MKSSNENMSLHDRRGSSCHHTAVIRYWWSHQMRTCSYGTGGGHRVTISLIIRYRWSHPMRTCSSRTGGRRVTIPPPWGIGEVIQWEHVPTGQEGSSCYHTAIIRCWWSHPMWTCSYMTGGVIVSPYRHHKVEMKSPNVNMFLRNRRGSSYHYTAIIRVIIRYWWSHPMRRCFLWGKRIK